MKKQIIAALIICSLLFTGVITSCDKDNENNKIENSQDNEQDNNENEGEEGGEQEGGEEGEQGEEGEEGGEEGGEQGGESEGGEEGGQGEGDQEGNIDDLTPPAPTSDDYSYIPNGVNAISGDDPTKVREILCSLTNKKKKAENPLLSLYYDDVTDSEIKEIKSLTSEIVKNKKSEYDKYNAIFKWIVQNIKYGWVPSENGIDSNRPSQVLKNKQCVCQGYANLLKAMCYTQNIQSIVANGGCYHNGRWLGDHAWNYVYVNGTWIVSDPTWHRHFDMKGEFEKHKKLLKASRLVLRLFYNDDFTIGYKNSEIAITEISSKASEKCFMPYSWKKFRVTSFDPDKCIPTNVKGLILGENITSFGNISGNGSGLINSNYGKNLEYIYIASNNPKYEAIDGIIYDKTIYKLYRLPILIMDYVVNAKIVYGQKFEKNIIVNKPNLESIYFPDSAKTIEDYAVENCPKLTKVSLPKNCKCSNNAFYNCNSNLEITYRENQ